MRGDQLAVYIGQANRVMVKEADGPYAASGQASAAWEPTARDAEDGDGGSPQPLYTPLSPYRRSVLENSYSISCSFPGAAWRTVRAVPLGLFTGRILCPVRASLRRLIV
jgi:hypothetical protein